MMELKFNLENERIKGIGLIEPYEFFNKIRDRKFILTTHSFAGKIFTHNNKRIILGQELESMIDYLSSEKDVTKRETVIIKSKEQILVRLYINIKDLDRKMYEWIIYMNDFK